MFRTRSLNLLIGALLLLLSAGGMVNSSPLVVHAQAQPGEPYIESPPMYFRPSTTNWRAQLYSGGTLSGTGGERSYKNDMINVIVYGPPWATDLLGDLRNLMRNAPPADADNPDAQNGWYDVYRSFNVGSVVGLDEIPYTMNCFSDYREGRL